MISFLQIWLPIYYNHLTFKCLLLLLFSCPVVRYSLQPHGLQHARPLCRSPTPEVCQVHVHCIGDAISHLILWCPLLLLPSTFPRIRDFTNESAVCIRWPKYWSFSISPSIDYSGWISLKIDWLVRLAVQGTHRSLLQHHISKASVLQHSTFFLVQLSLSLPCVTTGKTTALTVWAFVHRVMSLLFNTLSRFVIAFPPRSKCFLISWLQPPSTVILEPKKRKSITISTFFPLYLPRSNGARWHDLSFLFLFFSFKLVLSLSSFTLIKRLFSSSLISTILNIYCLDLILTFLGGAFKPSLTSILILFRS